MNLSSLHQSFVCSMSGKSFLRVLFGAARSTPAPRMPSIEAVEKLEARALQAENLIDFLKVEVAKLQKAVEANKISESSFVNKNQYEDLLKENQKLRQEIEEWKKKLINTEEKLNIVQVDVGTSIKQSSTLKERLDVLQEQQQAMKSEVENRSSEMKKEKVKPAKAVDTSKKAAAASAEKPVDVGRLDIRVGKIISVIKHPDADSLYVEDVDLGEGKPRTVVSGLVKFVPIEQLQNKMVVVLCNLKPAKMKGVTSEAMVLCASTPDKVEPLVPPKDAVPGDRIRVEGFQQEPDDVLNPKKKIFETVAVELKTDNMKNATYKGKPLYVPGKGFVTAPSLVNVNIK